MIGPISSILGLAALCVVAMLILGFRDKAHSKKLIRQLQKRLSNREGCSDSELISAFPLEREKEIAIKFRKQLSKALGIKPEKIHPEDDLHRDYHLENLSPFLIAVLASEFTHVPRKTGVQQMLSFKNEATKFTDFVRAISQQSK